MWFLKLRMVGKLEWQKCFYIRQKKQGGWGCVFFVENATLFNLNSPPQKKKVVFFWKMPHYSTNNPKPIRVLMFVSVHLNLVGFWFYEKNSQNFGISKSRWSSSSIRGTVITFDRFPPNFLVNLLRQLLGDFLHWVVTGTMNDEFPLRQTKTSTPQV